MGFLVKRTIWEQPWNWRLWTSFDWSCTHAHETLSVHERIKSARIWGFPQGPTPALAKSLKPWWSWRSILKWVSRGKHNLTLASNVFEAALRSLFLTPKRSPEQGFRHCFTGRPNQSLISCVAQTTNELMALKEISSEQTVHNTTILKSSVMKLHY